MHWHTSRRARRARPLQGLNLKLLGLARPEEGIPTTTTSTSTRSLDSDEFTRLSNLRYYYFFVSSASERHGNVSHCSGGLYQWLRARCPILKYNTNCRVNGTATVCSRGFLGGLSPSEFGQDTRTAIAACTRARHQEKDMQFRCEQRMRLLLRLCFCAVLLQSVAAMECGRWTSDDCPADKPCYTGMDIDPVTGKAHQCT
eukprot:124903-Rhodomonas_salina.2